MTDYMKKRAAQAAQLNNENPAQVPMTNGIPNSALLSVFEGKSHATSQMMGHKENLAPSVAAKMSQAFGMNFMDMQVYRSDAMKGTGMQGLTQGNKVIISSDVDLNTTRGQAVLGHEFSHVHAQSQGIGMGHSGLYENASLEAQADREGLLAAQGKPIYGDPMSMNPGMSYGLGMAGVEGLTPIGGGMSASAGAPMQAKKKGPKPKNGAEANRLMYDYAKGRSDKLNLDGMSDDEILATEEKEKGVLLKYAMGMEIPKDKMEEINNHAKELMDTDLSGDKKLAQQIAKFGYYQSLVDAARGDKMLDDYQDSESLEPYNYNKLFPIRPYLNLENKAGGIKLKRREDEDIAEDIKREFI